VLCKRLILILSVAATLGAAERTDYSHLVFRIEDGLPENRIRAISQTPDGYLWLGTGEGLARFDGVRFTVFDRSNTPALGDDGILSLRLASDGTLWIGTEGGGLVRYRAGQFRNYGVRDGLTSAFVRTIFEDSRGNLWIGTDRGFFRRDGDRFERLDNTPEVPLANVPSIAEDRDGRIQVVSSLGLLTVENGHLVPAAGNCDTTRIRNISSSGGDFLRVADSIGGGLLKNGCVEPDPQLAGMPLRVGLPDREGNFWIGTEGRGLLRISDGKVSPFEDASLLPGKTVNAIFEDREGNLWVGCEDGLLRLSRSSVANFGTAQGLEDENVLTVFPARSGELWIATVTGQVYSISESGVRRRILSGPGANLPVHTIYEDRSGAFWLGTSGQGVMRLTGAKTIVYSKSNGLRNNSVRQILQDGEGNIWIALASGLSRWDGTSFRNYYLEDGLSYPSTRCLLVDARGDILVGTDAGLNRIHNGVIVRDGEFAAVAHEDIWSLYQDSSGTLWIGTGRRPAALPVRRVRSVRPRQRADFEYDLLHSGR
jgi:ligand-binding sensor domain-containing protein